MLPFSFPEHGHRTNGRHRTMGTPPETARTDDGGLVVHPLGKPRHPISRGDQAVYGVPFPDDGNHGRRVVLLGYSLACEALSSI